MLKISLHSSKVPFSLIDNTNWPSISIGDIPNDLAVPLTHKSWLTMKILLLASGPSTVAVRLGASLTSKVIFSLAGRK